MQKLIDEVDPFLISEHLSLNMLNGIAFPDLFPIPYTTECLDVFCKNIDYAQNLLKKQLLIENPSTYIEFSSSQIEEPQFLKQLYEKTGYGILLDINNIFVSCMNHHRDPIHYINEIPKDSVKEIHLAGHDIRTLSDNTLLRVDTHDNFICEEVFNLYKVCLNRFGLVPSLIEWDAKIPSLEVLINEAYKLKFYMQPTDINFDDKNDLLHSNKSSTQISSLL